MTTVSIIKIVKIITVLLLVSIIPSSSYNNNNVVTATTTTTSTSTSTTSTLPQSVQEEEDVLPLSDQSFSSNNSTINLSNENSYDQQIAAVGNKSYVVWADFITGSGDIYFRRSIDGGVSFSDTINLSNDAGRSAEPQIAVSGSNIYVVWSDQTTTTGNADIFFEEVQMGSYF